MAGKKTEVAHGERDADGPGTGGAVGGLVAFPRVVADGDDDPGVNLEGRVESLLGVCMLEFEFVAGGSHEFEDRQVVVLALDAAGVTTDRGWIPVNEFLETNVPGIFALGDVTGGPAFTHISYNDYQIVFHNLFSTARISTAGRIVPYALFTDPELGRVGMTERAARATGRPILVGSIPMSRVARAIERGDTRGMMKVVVDAETEQILGAAIVGHGGGDVG